METIKQTKFIKGMRFRSFKLASFILALFLLCSCSKSYNVSGVISGLDNDTLFIFLENRDTLVNLIGEEKNCDTVIMKDGKFKFYVDDKYFTMGYIYPAGGQIKITNNGTIGGYLSEYIDFFLQKGETVEIDANYDGKIIQYTMSGSPLNEKYSEYRNALFVHQYKRYDALKEIRRLRSAGEPLTEGQKLLKLAMDSIRIKREVFLESNLDSPVAAYIFLMNNYNDPEILIANKGKFSPQAFDSPLSSEYLKIVNYFENNPDYNKQIQDRENAFYDLKGKKAPDFALNTISGEKFSLSSLKGKYALIKFWGSWCSGCLESMPEFVENSEKYSGEIIFIAVACKESETAWQNAVKKFKMEKMVNLLDSKDEVSTMFSVPFFPSYLVISPDGTMVPYGDINFNELQTKKQ